MKDGEIKNFFFFESFFSIVFIFPRFIGFELED